MHTDIRTQQFSRRTALTGLGLTAVGVSTANVATADTAGTCGPLGATMTVWMLASEWETPRGPHGKTRLVSNASRIAAANRYALTEEDALKMNLHVCSWAPAVPITVRRDEFMKLWDETSYIWHNPWLDEDVRIFDARCAVHVEEGPEVLECAVDVDGDEVTQTTTTTTTTTTTPAARGGVVAAPPRSLAFTGSGLSSAATGAGMLLLGASATLMARRRAVAASVQSGTDGSLPPGSDVDID